MGLFGFGKKDPCAICGEKVTGLLPKKIEGKLICSSCYAQTDLPEGMEKNMTVEDFRRYIAFRDENAKLKGRFNIMQEVDFGWFSPKFVFDLSNQLFCMDNNLEKTIFEGRQVKSFTIREDSAPLFEGGADGLRKHKSSVPDRLIAMMPELDRRNLRHNLENLADALVEDREKHHYARDIPEPFRAFHIDIHVQHPYWSVISAEVKGPTFSNQEPDANKYSEQYSEQVDLMEQLAMALMGVAFPNTSSDPVSPEEFAMTRMVKGAAAMSASAAGSNKTDAVEELKRYKALMDQGIITEEEFTAKKRQLLGI